MHFQEKGGGHSDPKSFIAKTQHGFPKRGQRGGGGVQRPFGVFPKIHPFYRTQASVIRGTICGPWIVSTGYALTSCVSFSCMRVELS